MARNTVPSTKDETKAALKDGRITMTVEDKDGKLTAKAPGMSVRLKGQAGWTREQILGSPQFEHNGRIFRGRFYPKGNVIAFQATRSKVSAPAKARVAAGGKRHKATSSKRMKARAR